MPIKINSDNIYTTKEAQEFLRVSESTMKRYLKKGIIKANKVGGRYKILGKELLKLVSPESEEKVRRVYYKVKEKVKKKIENW